MANEKCINCDNLNLGRLKDYGDIYCSREGYVSPYSWCRYHTKKTSYADKYIYEEGLKKAGYSGSELDRLVYDGTDRWYHIATCISEILNLNKEKYIEPVKTLRKYMEKDTKYSLYISLYDLYGSVISAYIKTTQNPIELSKCIAKRMDNIVTLINNKDYDYAIKEYKELVIRLLDFFKLHVENSNKYVKSRKK